MQDVELLLPHAPPMRLIDRVLAYNDKQVWGATAVQHVPFCNTLGLRACFALELMAQTAAAFFTLSAAAQEAPRQGMLVACRRFETGLAHFPAYAHLMIHARLDSPLPHDAAASALVKFQADIELFEQAADIPTSLDALAGRGEADAVSRADLSVYI